MGPLLRAWVVQIGVQHIPVTIHMVGIGQIMELLLQLAQGRSTMLTIQNLLLLKIQAF